MATKKENIDNSKSCFNKAHDDEPIFVLKATDFTAPETVLGWITKNINHQPEAKLREAFECALEMRRWLAAEHESEEPAET